MATKKKTKKVKENVVKPPLHTKEYGDCMSAHAGQSGYCDENGGWHPIV